jgi:uncharacterized protein
MPARAEYAIIGAALRANRARTINPDGYPMSEEIKSPCISVCLFEDGICTGCGMTEDESNKWRKFTDEEKIKVLQRLGKWPAQ